MDTRKFNALNETRQRLQGSLNYWNNAVHAMTQNTAKATSGQQRQDILIKLAYCQQRANHAQQRLDAIKKEMTALDPGGSIARQVHATRASRDKAKREIRQLEATLAAVDPDTKEHDYWRSRLDKKRQRLAVLENQLTEAHANQEATAVRHQPNADTLAILARINTWNTVGEAADHARQQPAAEALTPATLAPVIDGLRQAIAAAALENNPELLQQLQSSLDYLQEKLQ